MDIHDAVQGKLANGNHVNGDGSVESEAERLHSVKTGIELQLDAYYSQLRATPLVDPEGFPRADIDVATVRVARAQIIRLRNDLKKAIDDMALLLERGLPNDASQGTMTTPQAALKPFARVRDVDHGSPAADAGLLAGDEIVRFGVVNETNHANLQALAQLVQRSQGQAIPVSVIRSTSTIVLSLTPHTTWGGRGSLGCHIVPI